jgi:hypothetical protein
MYKYPHGWAGCIDGFIWVVKQTEIMHSLPVGAIIEQEHLVRENAASESIDSIWLVNNDVD